MTHAGRIVAFIDPGASTSDEAAAAIEALARADALGTLVSRAFIVSPAGPPAAVPPGWAVVSDVAGPQVCQWVFDTAAQEDASLLVVTGDWRPGREVMGALAEALASGALAAILQTRLDAYNRTVSGASRFIFFGNINLYEGLDFVPVAMGLFGVAEIISTASENKIIEIKKEDISWRKQMPDREDMGWSTPHILRGTALGE